MGMPRGRAALCGFHAPKQNVRVKRGQASGGRAHAFNLRTQEAEASKQKSSRPAWSIVGVLGLPRTQRSPVFWKKQTKTTK